MNKKIKGQNPEPFDISVNDVQHINNNLKVHPSITQLVGVIQSLQSEIGNAVSVHTSCFSKKKLEDMYDLKQLVEYILTFINSATTTFLMNCIEKLEKSKEKKSRSKKDKLALNVSKEFLTDQNIKKGIVNGTIVEFGYALGNLVGHLRNKNGDLLISITNEDLANLISLIFVSNLGATFKPKSLAISIGKGRNAKSLLLIDSIYKELND